MKRIFRSALSVAVAAALFSGCYGKDTGPKKPREKKGFMPVLEKFTARSRECIGEMVKANIGRPLKPSEKADKTLIEKGVRNLRKELLQCFTGKGYGNEVQIDKKHVQAWLDKKTCAAFAEAVFMSPRCSVLMMVLEDSGFNP
jgi:hypothetical protein